MGEAVAGKKAGYKAAIWGGVCGTIPDLDVIAGQFMHVVDSNAFHRTLSHSILFFLVASPLLGLMIKRIHRRENATWKDWTLLAFLALFTHALLDCFTTWGTGLFWPSDYKVAFQSIFVIDPMYTVPLLILLIAAMRLPREAARRRTLNYAGLLLSTSYLILTLYNKYQVNQVVKEELIRQEIVFERFETRPSPLNNILWGTTVETENGYYLGYYSFLDDDNKIDFHFYPKNHKLLDSLRTVNRVKTLTEISEGWYTVDESGKGLVFNDLRFGTNKAWEPGGSFIFSYSLKRENGELIITQNERSLTEDPSEVLSKLFTRMIGRKPKSQG